MFQRIICLPLMMLALCQPVRAQDLDPRAKAALRVAGASVGEAIKARDIVALEKLWSPNLVVNGPTNTVLTRPEVFDAIRNGQLDYEGEYQSKIERVEFFGDVAVVMADESVTPDFGPDRGKTIQRRSTNIWQYQNSAWIMIARQATIYNPAEKHY